MHQNLLLALTCYSVSVEALTLPSFRRDNHVANHAASSANNWNGETQLHSNSVSLTIDNAPSGLWKMLQSDNDENSNSNSDKWNNRRGRPNRQQDKLANGVPFGPVPRGGSLADIAVSANGAVALAPRQNTWGNVRSTVRTSVRGARRRVVHAVNMTVLRGAMNRRADAADIDIDASGADFRSMDNNKRFNMNGQPMLRVGGMINRRLSRRKRSTAAGMETIDCLDVMGDVDVWADTSTLESSYSTTATAAVATASINKDNALSIPIVRRLFQRKSNEQQQEMISTAYETASALSSRGGGASSAVTINKSSSPSISADRNTLDEEEYYIIRTPLFPIILPKSFEPRTASATSATADMISTTSLEISVAIQEEVTKTSTAKPSSQLLQAATQPLLPKQDLDSFTGREFYYPESYEALAVTGMQMTLGEGVNEHVKWTGEKKTDKFLKDHAAVASGSNQWYTALDSSQEVLVWAGKFTPTNGKDGYGSELPIIKTTSIIRQSPKFLAELLMDSKKVTVYNKMSLGRTDERIFQTGVDTQGGSFGDGESKVVRNLTKPPMVSSLIEFVTCMHARKLRPSDMEILSPSNTNCNDSNDDASSANNEGYVVVSRAVTGGEWSNENNSNSKSSNGEKLVRNEILLGVNILKAVPGEPDKTELTSVTHVYSPMIPLMLAKNAGVKGAVDFVRDIRALP